jgi:hypothetical protein
MGLPVPARGAPVIESYLDRLPDGTVMAAYDPELNSGTAWVWRREGACWVMAGGRLLETSAMVASRPNLTLLFTHKA